MLRAMSAALLLLATASASPRGRLDDTVLKPATGVTATTAKGAGAICVFSIDGYEWPTQPGDINDKRSFCDTIGPDGDDYKCLPGTGFSVKPYPVPNLVWQKVQHGEWNEDWWREPVTRALKDDDCRALIGNAGFFAFFTGPVNKLMYKILNDKKVCPDETACRPKPWLGSALSMVPVLVGEANRWKWENGADLLKPDENIHILTSEGGELENPGIVELLARTKVSSKHAKLIALYKTQDALGMDLPHFNPTFNNLNATVNNTKASTSTVGTQLRSPSLFSRKFRSISHTAVGKALDNITQAVANCPGLKEKCSDVLNPVKWIEDLMKKVDTNFAKRDWSTFEKDLKETQNRSLECVDNIAENNAFLPLTEYIKKRPALIETCSGLLDQREWLDKQIDHAMFARWKAKRKGTDRAWAKAKEDLLDSLKKTLEHAVECNLNLVASSFGARFAVTGLQDIPYAGRPIAIDASAYNAKSAEPLIVTKFRKDQEESENATQRKVGMFLVECSEAAPWANSLRREFGLAGWDITTVATCLMQAAAEGYQPSDLKAIRDGYAIFDHAPFKTCMLEWLQPNKYTTKFGAQPEADGTWKRNDADKTYKWKHYDVLSKDQLEDFICKGGRFEGGPEMKIARRMEDYCSAPLLFTSGCTVLAPPAPGTISPGPEKNCSCGHWTPALIKNYTDKPGKDTGACGEPCPNFTCPGGGQCGVAHPNTDSPAAECGLYGEACAAALYGGKFYGNDKTSSSCSVP